ncbi:hypothetical protein SEA_PHILLIS_42 [Mycobacterium phage Phillis]|nr:hypothetical protein SEA_PHILLIS_42 [Mycobacterium phage Phillis]
MARDYLEEAKSRIGYLSDASDYALIDIAESLRVIKAYITAPHQVFYNIDTEGS